ncbi:TOTE conflict system archaeo-eukaryotic primase domain-containing protein [Corynebacterium nuruki]|uniref:TOTE conflict system archaeo-eukaryotic primase domain-containing protein n=1 Tax=Corynebacterium nuruki TaxID=1032851 RepID=UPI0039BED3A1
MNEDLLHALAERVAALESELVAVREELDALTTGRGGASRTAPSAAGPEYGESPLTPAVASPPASAGAISRASSAEEKIALFADYFSGRPDVYAQRWESTRTGKKGWSPAASSGFYRSGSPASDLAPLTLAVIDRHLRRSEGKPFHAGLYPLFTDDTCRLLACDFDDGSWRQDAAAYALACRDHGLDPLCEISSSGDGAHVWLFFSEPVPASLARSTGLRLLQEAMESRPGMSFTSFDRFFPAQDSLPVKASRNGRFGNLIALPLEGDHRTAGTTVFADPQDWAPLPDQFAALAATTKAPTAELDRVCSELARFAATPESRQTDDRLVSVGPRPAKKELRRLAAANKGTTVRVTHDSHVHVPIPEIDAETLAYLRHLGVLSNPAFYRKQAMRYSTYGTPRLIVHSELDDRELRLPRGLLDETIAALKTAGYTVSRRSRTQKPPAHSVTFTGVLRKEQDVAVNDVLRHRNGMLVAHPGAGKTVMACAVIAARQTSTVIVVPTQEIARQWRSTLLEVTDLRDEDIGLWFGQKKTQTRVVDIFSAKAMGRGDFDTALLAGYGQIIVDECHGAAATGLRATLDQLNTRYWLGLTATDYRSDGMDRIIVIQLGPVRHLMTGPESPDMVRTLVTHTTAFTVPDEITGDDMPEIYNLLAADTDRTRIIVNAVVKAVRAGENCLVLCNRVTQIHSLRDLLGECLVDDAGVLVRELFGGQSAEERSTVRTELESAGHFVLIAMDKIASEGLDLPTLDTVFLCSPVSFKGNIIQRIGRVTRGGTGSAMVHDFHDTDVPALHRMFMKRRRVIEKAGFTSS